MSPYAYDDERHAFLVAWPAGKALLARTLTKPAADAPNLLLRLTDTLTRLSTAM